MFFSLTKPEALTTAAHISTEVERELEPLAYEIDRGDAGVTYRISSFAPGIRYSMFGPFSEVSLIRKGGAWVLRMKPTKLLLLPFALFAVALMAFRTVGPIGIEGLAIAIGVPIAVVLFALIEARVRLRNWWNRL